jgi:threonine/homoserine/homoserine lactone efflux protein
LKPLRHGVPDADHGRLRARSFKTVPIYRRTFRGMPDLYGLSLTLASADASVARPRAAGTLVLASLAIMGTPGPSTISLVATAVAHGTRRSLAYCVGLVVGAILVLVATATGATAVLLTVPALHWGLIVVAAGYLLWLAYHLATAAPLSEQTTSHRRPSFTSGILLGITNPKAWIAMTAVFASARLANTAVADATLKVPLIALMTVLIHGIWLLAGRLLMPWLHNARRAHAVNMALAGLLVVAGGLTLL